jgi:hypothetical protein
MGVPGVTMHQVGIYQHGIEVGAPSHRPEHRLKRLRTSERFRINLKTADGQIALVESLITKATNIDLHQFRELAREIFNVNPCSAVGVRRVFVRQEKSFQANGVLDCSSEGVLE